MLSYRGSDPCVGSGLATRRVLDLTAELAAELPKFEVADLDAADVQALMQGMNRTAAALTRILDQLREYPVLAQPENELGPPRHDSVRSELEQAAAAAEDLQTATESLCRLQPAELLGPPPPQ